MIVRKSDGAANYASSDLATILYRVEHFRADAVLYVVDKRQSDHFEQLFLTARKWFAATHRNLPELEHVDFGTVLGENGKPLKTRSGDNIRLKDLLAEAEERAFQLVSERSPDLPEAERRTIARVVGIGSVQYADLAQNRSTDYVFAWDKMISLEGNTAAYLLYALARIKSILRRQHESPLSPSANSRFERDQLTAEPAPGLTFETTGEIALARKLLRFPDTLRQATDSLRPHFLALYLYELAGEFSGFYTTDKVLVDDAPVRERRLDLCRKTALLLEQGLRLLGLRTLDRMTMHRVWRILLLTARTYHKTHASTRAASLSFSSLLGMGPLIALIVILGSPILGRRDPMIAAKALNRVLHLIAPQIHEYEQLSESGKAAIAAEPSFNPKLTEILDGFVRGAHRGSAGTFGALTLAVIVFLLFGTIERSFNEIWDVPQGRSFFRTLVFHLTFLLAGSALFFSAAVLLTATAFLNVFIEGSPMARQLWPFLHWTAPTISFLFLAGVLTLSYRLIPNTQVRWGAAAIGAEYCSDSST